MTLTLPSAAEEMRVALEPLITLEVDLSIAQRRATLSSYLKSAYGTDLTVPLRLDRPTIIANFVSTIDGVVSYNTPEQAGGGEISGFYKPDGFVMGLLRSVSDAVLIGAGTLRAAPDQAWSPRYTHPPSADEYARLRNDLGLSPEPTTVVVTARSDIDLGQRGMRDPSVPVLIITTDKGLGNLRWQQPFAGHVEVVSVGDGDDVPATEIVRLLNERGMSVVLCEGGPHLFGQMLDARLVDELFLTVAPQVAGRATETARLSLVEGSAFTVKGAPWSRLADIRKSGDHLFLRYQFGEVR
ncbi:MAG TPA: dihydrofolate reductase family protein [Candidatus Limnocylindria bacterium]|nr:dihydrofolate reductase family protein [Candidatus Limnocylindria bacterium]